MPFQFTFSLPFPFFNPFARSSHPTPVAEPEDDSDFEPIHYHARRSRSPPARRRKLPPPPTRTFPASASVPSAPRSKKRGWVPSEGRASPPVTSKALQGGYLDTPAKYTRGHTEEYEVEEMVADTTGPPAKRRRFDIISSAVNLAIVSTAVGITAYRLWRDRGKTIEGPSTPASNDYDAPPPYAEDEWVDDSVRRTPISPRSRRTHRAPGSARRTAMARRRAMNHGAPLTPSRGTTPTASSSQPTSAPASHETEMEDPEMDIDEQMDWMSERLRGLIEEGKKALGSEIVLEVEGQDNENGATDDGAEGWEEENSSGSIPVPGRSHRRLGSAMLSSSVPSNLGSAMPVSPRSKRLRTSHSRNGSLSSSYRPPSPNRRSRGLALGPEGPEKVLYTPGSYHETSFTRQQADLEDEQSRELRETMERVRAAYRQRAHAY